MSGCAGDDTADTSQPVGAAGQRQLWLERQAVVRQMRVAGGHIRRVGDDEVEGFSGHRRKPVSLAKIDTRPEPPGIVACHGYCPGREVDRDNGRRRAFQRQRDGNDARTGAEIEYPRCRPAVQSFECKVDQDLGFRPRNQHIRRNLEDTTTEFGLADQIGQRLAACPARDPGHEQFACRRGDRSFRPYQQVGVRTAGGMLQQQSRIEPVDFPPCCGQRLQERHCCSPSSASRSA